MGSLFYRFLFFLPLSLFSFCAWAVEDGIYDFYSCWTCPLFDYMFYAISRGGYVVFIEMRPYALQFLALGLGLWLVFYTLSTFGSGPGRPGKYLTEVGQRLFTGLFITFAVLLAEPSYFYKMTLDPLADMILDYSDRILAPFGDLPTHYERSASLQKELEEVGQGAFDQAIGDYFVGLVDRLSYLNARQMQIGYVIWKYVLDHEVHLGNGLSFQDIGLFLLGGAIIVLYFLINALFPFYLIEGVFRIGVALMLLPFLAVSFVFPSLRHFTEDGFEMIVQGFLIILFVTIVFALSSAMTDAVFGAFGSAHDRLTALLQGDVAQLVQNFSLQNVQFIQLLAIGLITFFLLVEAADFATKFSVSRGARDIGLMELYPTKVDLGSEVQKRLGKAYAKFFKRKKSSSDSEPAAAFGSSAEESLSYEDFERS